MKKVSPQNNHPVSDEVTSTPSPEKFGKILSRALQAFSCDCPNCDCKNLVSEEGAVCASCRHGRHAEG